MTILNLVVDVVQGDDGSYDRTAVFYGDFGVLVAGNGLVGDAAHDSHALFKGASGLAGATINSAVYSVNGYVTPVPAGLSKIRLEVAASPAAIDDAADWNARTLTTAGVDWDAALTPEAWNDSPSLVPLIEEIKSLNPSNIHVFHLDDGSDAGAGLVYNKANTGFPARLDIDYTAAAAGGLIARGVARGIARGIARSLTNRN